MLNGLGFNIFIFRVLYFKIELTSSNDTFNDEERGFLVSFCIELDILIEQWNPIIEIKTKLRINVYELYLNCKVNVSVTI